MNKLLATGLILYIIILEIRLVGYASYFKQIQEHLMHHDDIIHEINNKLYDKK